MLLETGKHFELAFDTATNLPRPVRYIYVVLNASVLSLTLFIQHIFSA